MNPMQLAINFKQLSEVIFDELKKRKIIDNFESIKIFIPNLASLRFRDGKVNYILEKNEIQKPIIGFDPAIPKFYNEFCKKLPEFQEILKTIEESFQIPENQVELIFRDFTQYLIYKITHGLDKTELNRTVNKYIQKLQKEIKTPYIKTKIFLEGVWLTTENLIINENLTIRRIKSSDFETQSPEELEQEFPPFGNFPYSIVKYKIPLNFESINVIELQREVLRKVRTLINALLLFRYGSVFSRKSILPVFQSTNPDVIMQGVTGSGYNKLLVDFTYGRAIHTNPNLQIKTRHTYVVSEKDIPGINNIFEIFNKEEIKPILFPKPKTSNYIYLALNRYQNAFLNVESIESQISYAISCLEALFSMKGADLKRKLSQRMSLIFRILSFNPLKISTIVSNAYNVRSDYSHGEIVNYEGKEKLSRQILQCARISLLIFLQIDPLLSEKNIILKLHGNRSLKRKNSRNLKKDRKRYFLEILDYALIDEKTYTKLKVFLENCSVFY